MKLNGVIQWTFTKFDIWKIVVYLHGLWVELMLNCTGPWTRILLASFFLEDSIWLACISELSQWGIVHLGTRAHNQKTIVNRFHITQPAGYFFFVFLVQRSCTSPVCMDKNPYFIKVLKEKAPILSDYVLKNMWSLTQFLHVLIEVFTFVQFIFFSFPAGHFSFRFFLFRSVQHKYLTKSMRDGTNNEVFISVQTVHHRLSLFLSPADYCIVVGSSWVSWGDCALIKILRHDTIVQRKPKPPRGVSLSHAYEPHRWNERNKII